MLLKSVKISVFKHSILVSAVCLALVSGCSKNTDSSQDNKKPQDGTNTTVTSSNADKSMVNTSNTVAAILSEGFFMGFNISMESSNISPDKKSCLTSIDKLSATKPLQQLLEKELSKNELDELNAFYSSEFGKKFIRFSREQVQVMTGEIDQPTIVLNDDDEKKLYAYMKTEGAKKLMNINGGADQDKMISAVKPLIIKQAEKCNISKEELVLP